MASPQSDITVIGGGVIGATMALSLAKQTDYTVTLLEQGAPQSQKDKTNPRALALGAAATRLLDKLELMPKTDAYPYHTMVVWDAAGKGELRFRAAELGLKSLGVIIAEQPLLLRLQTAVTKHPRIRCHFRYQPEALHRQKTECHIVGSPPITTRLVIAADGGNSWARRQAKILHSKKPYEQLGIVAQISTAEGHQDTAWQVFSDGGTLAVLPLTAQTSALVWSTATAEARRLLHLNEQEFCLAVAETLQNRLGEVRLLSQRHSFALLSGRAAHYFKRRLALIGDAAHSIHPLAGQGANLGFQDIITLSALLRDCPSSEIDALSTLQQYEQQRKGDNEQADWLMNALYHGFRYHAPYWVKLRNLGMNCLNRSNTIKRLLAQRATGII